MKRNIIFALLCGIIVFTVAFAVICPLQQGVRLVPTGDPIAVATPDTGKVISQGEISADGGVDTVDGVTCTVEFPVNASVKSLTVNYAAASEYTLSYAIHGTTDGTFSDLEPVIANISFGDTDSTVTMLPAEYTAVRVDFPKDCVIKNVSFYNTLPTQESYTIELEAWRYALVALITLAAAVGAFLADRRYDIFGAVLNCFKANRKGIILALAGAVGAVAFGVTAELIFRAVVGADSLGKGFNITSFSMFAAMAACLLALLLGRKSLAERPERPLFFIIMAVGIFIILSQPMGHICWDLDSHYPWALENSYFRVANYTEADLGIKYGTMVSTMPTYADSEATKDILYNVGELVTLRSGVSIQPAHIPAGIFIAIARLFGAGFYTRYLCGEFANLLLYAIVVFFAVRKLKSGKMILSVIALFPTNLYVASNYSYDYWTTAFAFLGVAYFVSEAEQPDKPLTVWNTVIMCGAFMLAALPKQVFVMLLLLPLFMRKNWVDRRARRNYFLILLAFFAATFAIFVLRSFGTITGGGDTRGGDVDPVGQIKYIFTSPFEYAGTLIKFLMKYLSIGTMKDYISYFAYLGHGSLYLVFVVLLGFTALTDKCERNRFKGSVLIRIAAVLLLLGGASVIASALYVAFTPVGLKAINGCQPRYVIPLLAPVVLTIANPGIRIIKNKAIYNLAVLSVLTAAVMYEIITVIALPMM